MEQGPVEQKIIDQCMREGIPLPDRIQNAPSLWAGLNLYYNGFHDLSASRMTGFGLGPIWWSTIQQYCDSLGLSEEQTETMHHHIREMDTAYLKHMAKKS